MKDVGGGGVFEAAFAAFGDGGTESAGNDYLSKKSHVRVELKGLEGLEGTYIIWVLFQN